MMEEDGGFESAAATTTAGNDNYNGNGSTSSSSGSGGSFLSDHGAGPPPFVFTSSSSKRPEPNSTTTSPSPPKKSGSRRSVQKRVVSMPITDADGSRSKGTGDGAPPSDSWTWRKYGQKPIKGSPYPRGYYRCSSSKGCPARKQVERSRTDPTMLVVTYASEHNHPWPLPKNHTSRQQSSQSSAAVDAPCPSQKPTSTEEEMEEEVVVVVVAPPAPSVTATTNTATTTSSPEETSFSADLAEEPSLMLTDDFGWLSWASEAFLDGGSVAMLPAAFDDLGQDLGARGGVGDEEDALFAELDELPECSMVLRRGAAADSSLWYTSTTTSWCGSTG